MHLFDGPTVGEFDPTTTDPLRRTELAAVLKLRDVPEMSLRALELARVPDALPRESPSSWLARAAMSQLVSVGDLLTYFGWRPNADFDVWFADWFDAGVAAPGKEFRALEVARRVLHNLSAGAWSAKQLLLHDQGKSRYRFCPMCFAADDTPYLRQEWRFDTWRVCWEHGCLMEDTCAQCGTYLTAPLNMVSAAKGQGIGLLAECGKCGAWLSRRRPPLMLEAVQHVLSPHQMTCLQNGRALMAILWCGHGHVDGIRMPTSLEGVRRFAERALLAIGDAVPSTAQLWCLCGLLGDADPGARRSTRHLERQERAGPSTPVCLGGLSADGVGRAATKAGCVADPSFSGAWPTHLPDETGQWHGRSC